MTMISFPPPLLLQDKLDTMVTLHAKIRLLDENLSVDPVYVQRASKSLGGGGSNRQQMYNTTPSGGASDIDTLDGAPHYTMEP